MLPFRLDYVVKVSTLRRLGGVRLGLETVGLSIISLGLVDAVAMLPLAVAAIDDERRDLPCPADRGAALLPRLHRCPRARAEARAVPARHAGPRRLERIFTRVGDHASISRSTFAASGFLFCCWTTRALGSALLLSSLGVGSSPSLALVILCMAAAASILPITAGGAIVSVGATSGVLLALGVTPGRGDQLLAGVRHAPRPFSALAATVIGVGGSLFFTAPAALISAMPRSRREVLRAQVHAASILGATLDLPGASLLARRARPPSTHEE